MGRGEESQTLEKWRWSFFIFLVSFFLSGGGWGGGGGKGLRCGFGSWSGVGFTRFISPIETTLPHDGVKDNGISSQRK